MMRCPPRYRNWFDTELLPQAGRLTVSGLPGYTGYVPGKVAENVHGGTFQVVNEMATNKVDRIRAGVTTPLLQRGQAPAPGTEVPGYTGFVPGRHVDNVFGQSNAKAAETAYLIKGRQQAERQHRVEHYRQGRRPPTGEIDYAGYRTIVAPSGVDKRLAL